ncbi:MAG TPA: hypothetical protein VK021_09145 [Flavobacteriaceae bacterium]|nr:hypothetical protein [Flavobacteriaceae bacterium]
MKRYFYFSLLGLLIVSSCFTPKKNCERFKTGTFEYQTYADGELIKAKIVRNDSLEIDYYNPQEPDTSSIRWINECEYILRKYNPKSSDEKQSFKMKIIETETNRYTFEFSQVGQDMVKEFNATRIEED